MTYSKDDADDKAKDNDEDPLRIHKTDDGYTWDYEGEVSKESFPTVREATWDFLFSDEDNLTKED